MSETTTRPRSALDPDVLAEIAVAAEPGDERVWVPQADGVWFRPLLLNVVTGQWCNLLRVSRAGEVSRHRHAGAVFGYVLKGRWAYREHDWVAETGHFVYEPPGEIHTLYVPEGCSEMITFFNISGAMIYVGRDGALTGYEDAVSKVALCRAHYGKVGLGADYVEQFIR